MVRTLDFQSKNVGSIPSDPNMLLNHTFFINKNLYKNSFFFDFFFVSFFAPNFLKNFTSFFNIKYFNTKKIHLKQSYLLFSWFYYLTIVTKKNGKIL